MKSRAYYLTEKQITQFAVNFFADPDNSVGLFRWDIVVRVHHCVYSDDDLGDSIKVVATIQPRNFDSNSPIRLYLSTVRDVMAGATLARDFATLDAAFNAACGLVDQLREAAQDHTDMLLSAPYAGHVEYDRSIFDSTNSHKNKESAMAIMTTIITGTEAIEYAEEHDITLNKYADPTEEARSGLSAEEAREVAAEDPSLIWVEANGG